MTFSIALASPTMRGVWKVRAMPSAARACGVPNVSAADPIRASPACGTPKPEMTLSVVVLPLPLADQPMHLAAPEVEIQPVDRAHAAKVQADAGRG